jgi:hypothetical protein
VLLARCEFFRAMINFDRDNPANNVIVVEESLLGNDPKASMQLLMEYLYNGCLALQMNTNTNFQMLVDLFVIS